MPIFQMRRIPTSSMSSRTEQTTLRTRQSNPQQASNLTDDPAPRWPTTASCSVARGAPQGTSRRYSSTLDISPAQSRWHVLRRQLLPKIEAEDAQKPGPERIGNRALRQKLESNCEVAAVSTYPAGCGRRWPPLGGRSRSCRGAAGLAVAGGASLTAGRPPGGPTRSGFGRGESNNASSSSPSIVSC